MQDRIYRIIPAANPERKNLWQRLLDVIEQPLVLAALFGLGGVVGALLYTPLFILCALCLLLGLHRSGAMSGQSWYWQLAGYVALAAALSIGGYLLYWQLDKALDQFQGRFANKIVKAIKQQEQNPPPVAPSPAPVPKGKDTGGKFERIAPSDMFSVSIEWARLSSGGKGYGTNFWVYYPSETGCETDPIQAAYFIRVKNLRSIPISVVGYGVSVWGAPLKRISPQIGGVVGIPYKDGRMFGTTRDLVDALRPGMAIDFGQGSGFSWADVPIVEGSNFKKGVLLQLDLMNQLLKTPLQPNVPVRGWAFFQTPNERSFAVMGPTRITLETDDSQTFSYDIDLNHPNWELDNLDRIVTVKSFLDLSSCVRD